MSNRNTHPADRRSFYDSPTIRVAVWLLNNAEWDTVVAVDQDAAAACSVSVRDYRGILRRLEAAGMLTRSLHEPGGRRGPHPPRTLTLHPTAPAWRGVTGWIDLRCAEDHVASLGVAAGRTMGGGN
jgi:hypothetical protein